MRQPRCGNADLGDTDEQQFFTNGTNLTQPHTRLRRYTIEGVDTVAGDSSQSCPT
jgi:hypothetical protein